MSRPTARERWDALVRATAEVMADPADPDGTRSRLRAALDAWLGRHDHENPRST